MFRRDFLALMLLAASAGIGWPMPARADDAGDSGGTSDGGSSGAESDSSSSSWDSGTGSETSSSSDSHARESGSGPSTNGGSSDQAGARRAVEDKSALPLKDVLEIFGRKYGGEVVDASLIHGDAALRYRIKYIDAQGHVRRVYFDALTGQSL